MCLWLASQNGIPTISQRIHRTAEATLNIMDDILIGIVCVFLTLHLPREHQQQQQQRKIGKWKAE